MPLLIIGDLRDHGPLCSGKSKVVRLFNRLIEPSRGELILKVKYC